MKRLLPFLLVFILSAAFLKIDTQAAGPAVVSESAVLMDFDTGQILFEKNPHERLRPASITKIMTVLLALENAKPEDVVTMSHDAVFSIPRGSSHIALTTDEQVTVKDLCYAAMLPSANDACNGIAEFVSGSMDAFVQRMNERARELGATDTTFQNAHGLDEDEHLTTAYDMAMIARACMARADFLEIVGTASYQIAPTNKNSDTRYLHNKHDMLLNTSKHYDGVLGGKLGWTTLAQHTLVTFAERDGRRLIAVVMKSPKANDKYTDTAALFDYGFGGFSTYRADAAGLIRGIPRSLLRGDLLRADITAAEDFTALIPNEAAAGDVHAVYYLPEELEEDGSTELRVTFTLERAVETFPAELGSMALRYSLPAPEPEEPSDTALAPEPAAEPGWLAPARIAGFILLGIAAFALIVFLALFAVRCHNIRKRRRLRARSRARRIEHDSKFDIRL